MPNALDYLKPNPSRRIVGGGVQFNPWQGGSKGIPSFLKVISWKVSVIGCVGFKISTMSQSSALATTSRGLTHVCVCVCARVCQFVLSCVRMYAYMYECIYARVFQWMYAWLSVLMSW